MLSGLRSVRWWFVVKVVFLLAPVVMISAAAAASAMDGAPTSSPRLGGTVISGTGNP